MANNVTRISELDFFEIRENLKNFLRSQDEFTDYDFEGSGMSVLLDLLTYNTHYMAYYLNMVGTEMFMDAAQLRASMVSHGKLMNYVPTSVKGAHATIDILVTPGTSEDNDITTATIDRGTNFLSDPIDGITYNFVTVNSNTATKVNGSFAFTGIVISQGEYVTADYEVVSGNDKRRFNIPSANVDTATISVAVQESQANTYTEVYSQMDDLTEITSTSRVFYVEENADDRGTYTVYFGDGVLGKRPSDGNIVKITYLDSQGTAANKANTFTLTDDIDGFTANVAVTTTQQATGGSGRETIEQIRFRAPYFYTAQNRMVTKNDYRVLLTKDYPNIQSISVWGGEENDPPIYGKVFISLNPVENYYISLDEKERIKTDIIANRAVLTVIPEIVDPDYVYLITNTSVEYDDRLTELSGAEIATLVRQGVLDFKDAYLNKFNSTFRLSRLESDLTRLDKSILGVTSDIYLQKRVTLEFNQNRDYTIDFGIPLYKGSIFNSLYSTPGLLVNDSSGNPRTVFFEEEPESFTGIDYIDITYAGTDYYSTPEVTITGDGYGATAVAKMINGKITEVTVTNRGTGYTRATVTFSYGNATAEAISEVNNGTLRTYYYRSNGEKVIVNEAAGTIDYRKGRIKLSGLFPLSLSETTNYDDDILTLNIKPEKDIVVPSRNQILTLDENDPVSIKVSVTKTYDR